MQVAKWLRSSGISSSEQYQQIAAVCQHLFTSPTQNEIHLVTSSLKRSTGNWSVELQLAICVQDEDILRMAVKQIVDLRNAAVYTAALQVKFSFIQRVIFNENICFLQLP